MGNTKETICRDCKKKALEEKTMMMSKKNIEEALEEIKTDEKVDNSQILESEVLSEDGEKQKFLDVKKRTEKNKERLENLKNNIEEKTDKGIKKIDIFHIFEDEKDEDLNEEEEPLDEIPVQATQKINSKDLDEFNESIDEYEGLVDEPMTVEERDKKLKGSSKKPVKKKSVKKRKKNGGLIKVIVGLIILGVIGIGGYALVNSFSGNTNNSDNPKKTDTIKKPIENQQDKDSHNDESTIGGQNGNVGSTQDSGVKVDTETNEHFNTGNESTPDKNNSSNANTGNNNSTKPDSTEGSGNSNQGSGNSNTTTNGDKTPDSNSGNTGSNSSSSGNTQTPTPDSNNKPTPETTTKPTDGNTNSSGSTSDTKATAKNTKNTTNNSNELATVSSSK
ncbi:MAG: hypothetical protein ACRCTZ_16335 [Sarcina sp.]